MEIRASEIWMNRILIESHPEIFQKPPTGHPRWRVYANPPDSLILSRTEERIWRCADNTKDNRVYNGVC